jgi:hypothetical protein
MTEDEILSRLYDQDGHLHAEVQKSVEDAIKRYPNFDAEWWLGGVAAIRAVLGILGIDPDQERENAGADE